MRYLDKRADFLSQRQHIITEEVKPIYEAQSGAGPFANDVGWNDSLLGRLINHMIRKARIAAKVPRIKTLIERLNAAFEELVGQSIVFSCSQETQNSITNVQIVSIYYELIFAVESGESVLVLKSLTDNAISNTEASNFEKKDILLEELKKFREFLNQFDDSVGSSDDESDTTTNTGGLSDVKLYDLMFKNLEALKNIIYYKDVVKKDVEKPTFKVGDIVTFTDSKGKKKKVKILSLDHTVTTGDDKIFLTADDGPEKPVNIKPNLYVVDVDSSGNPIKYDKGYAPFAAPAEKLTVESMIFEKENQQYRNPVEKTRTNTIGNKSGANIDRNNIFKGEDPHLSQALDNLKKAIAGLIGSQNQPPITIDFINNILKNKTDNRKIIKSLYKEINEFMVGKYKLSDLGPLYKKESIGVEYLTKQNQLNMVAKKIALFAKRAIQFNGENMYGGLGDLGKHLKIFVDTIIPLTKATINESVNLSYSSFLEAKNILSNDKDATSGENTQSQGEEKSKASGKAGKLSADSEKILVFFNETCVEVRKFTITDETKDSAKKEFEEKSKDYKPIMTMDPIIEIMKIFIKAYKLYTVKTITKRTENVDTNTLSEYTLLGSADESGKKGPYRNNKLFDMWEDAVNDIRKNRKYQVFFTKNAGLRLPKVADPNPNNPDDWEVKDDAGILFNRFINDVMDGDELYKKTGEGSVKTFLEKYFGEGSVTASQEKNGNSVKPDLEDVTDLNNQIQAGAIDLIFKQSDKTGGEYINTFFAIDYDNIDDNGATTKGGKYFFYVSDGFNLIFNDGFDMFSNFLVGPKRNIDKGDLNDLGSRSDFRYTLLTKKEDIAAGSNLKFEYSVFNKESIKETKKIKVKKVYRLVYKNDDGKLYRLEGDALTRWYKDLGRRNYIAPPTAAGVKAKVDKSNPKITKI